jgi:predicted short-subunit dehydrogenase-like oxidoreductase (DUF2520 family)
MGSALTARLRDAGHPVDGPLGRDDDVPSAARIVLLAVPDSQIAAAARRVPSGPLVGHLSGATTLADTDFSLHPLMTVTGKDTTFAGATAAIAGRTPEALEAARGLATTLGLRAVEVDDDDRAAYHAAASIASNFLVTLEGAAERLAATTGLDREALLPLVRAAVENWGSLGAERALTGPIARGDEETVARQREAIADRTPELLGLFDALADATRDLAKVRV